jgi:ABC-type transport system involved in multi-copper enzyme maturation permease subunit
MSGGVILIWLLFAVVISPAVGYWCMTVFRRKGKSPGAGFALGFFLTFLFTIIGAAIAVAISYGQSTRL